MKQRLKYLFASAFLAGALAGGQSLYAAEAKAKAEDNAAGAAQESTHKAPAKRDWYPFGGTVASVDKKANTISLKKKEGERVLKLDAKSELEINGKPGVLGGVKPGDYAHGKLHKDGAGHEVILAAKFDKEKPKKDKEVPATPPGEAPAPKPKK